MPSNYRRGYDTERLAIAKLREEGYIAARTAGSHGFFDVVAVPLNGGAVRLIQVKRFKKPPSARQVEAIASEIREVLGTAKPESFQVELWVYVDRFGFALREVIM